MPSFNGRGKAIVVRRFLSKLTVTGKTVMLKKLYLLGDSGATTMKFWIVFRIFPALRAGVQIV